MNEKPILKLTDGNAFSILAQAKQVAEENGIEFSKILREATAGDYNHLIQTLAKYFEVR